MIQRDLRISSKPHLHAKDSNTAFASQAQQLGSRLQLQMSIASQTSNESRVLLKSTSEGEEMRHLYFNESCVLSQTQSMSLLL